MEDKVLIIEDDEMLCNVLRKALAKDGYTIFTAFNAEEGLVKFKDERPSVVLLDLRLPGMDGIDFLKALDPSDILNHPIIVLTGQEMDRDIETCYQLGVQSFLNKPINFYQLKGQIKRSCDITHANAKIKRLNQQMERVLEHLPDVVWECDANFNFTYISSNSEKVLGYTANELLGKPVTSIVPPEQSDQLKSQLYQELRDSIISMRSIPLECINKDQTHISLQISANRIFNPEGEVQGIAGIFHDLQQMAGLEKNLEKTLESMTLRIDEDLKISCLSSDLKKWFPPNENGQEELPHFSHVVKDPALLNVLAFCFDQKENAPFPISVQLTDAEQNTHEFSIQFSYDEDHYLKGQVISAAIETQLSMAAEKLEEQEEQLKEAVMVDDDMRESILTDSHLLAAEILTLVKTLHSFAFPPDTGSFDFESFQEFMSGRSAYDYKEQMRLLGNKIHGIKGLCGFLVPEAKQICHEVENITRPLAEIEIVYTTPLALLLKNFIFRIQEILESYQVDHQASFDVSEDLVSLTSHLEQAQQYIGEHTETFASFINERAEDKGELRQRRKDDYLSVSEVGYELLSQQVKNLFYSVSEGLSGDRLVRTNGLYNEFLDTHQSIKKVPVDLTRYERLIPSIAKEYDKEAEFIFKDHGVLADREFWNMLHEIFNHTLKNAVIHGVETPETREAESKDPCGQVIVDIQEDALSISVTIEDDGQGINSQKILEKAIENRLVSVEAANDLSESDIFKLIFAQGVSTAESVDDNAGRGVGMNAVQEAIDQFNGSYHIESTLGKGTSWTFRFPKSNVSLSCFIVTIDDFRIAIPEEHVEGFQSFQEEQQVEVNQKPAYRYQQQAIPLLNTQDHFASHIQVNTNELQRVMLLQDNEQTVGLTINGILHHATLPVLPLPEEYRSISAYLGATYYQNQPVLILNTENLSC